MLIIENRQFLTVFFFKGFFHFRACGFFEGAHHLEFHSFGHLTAEAFDYPYFKYTLCHFLEWFGLTLSTRTAGTQKKYVQAGGELQKK